MLSNTQYQVALARAETLTTLDPELNTPAADELLDIVRQIDEYERHHFPHLFNNKAIITGPAE